MSSSKSGQEKNIQHTKHRKLDGHSLCWIPNVVLKLREMSERCSDLTTIIIVSMPCEKRLPNTNRMIRPIVYSLVVLPLLVSESVI